MDEPANDEGPSKQPSSTRSAARGEGGKAAEDRQSGALPLLPQRPAAAAGANHPRVFRKREVHRVHERGEHAEPP